MIYGKFLEQIDSEPKAYILGLMYADGCIPQGTISLKETDRQLLIDITNLIDTKPPVYSPPREDRYSNIGLYRISISKEKENLAKYLGWSKEKWPSLPDNLYPHFIRGIFDGDGCICLDQRYINMYPGKAIPGTFYILFNLLEHAATAQNIICKSTGINKTKITPKTGQGSVEIYKLVWSGTKNVISIRDWLYKDATIFLERKKILIDSIRLGDRKAASSAGGKAASEKRWKGSQVTWTCSTCNKTKTTRKSRQGIYCSKKCSNQRRSTK